MTSVLKEHRFIYDGEQIAAAADARAADLDQEIADLRADRDVCRSLLEHGFSETLETVMDERLHFLADMDEVRAAWGTLAPEDGGMTPVYVDSALCARLRYADASLRDARLRQAKFRSQAATYRGQFEPFSLAEEDVRYFGLDREGGAGWRA